MTERALTSVPQAAIHSPTNAQKFAKEQIGANPVGTGPFKLESFTAKTEVTLAANPDYFRGAPALQRIVFRVIPDQATRRLVLRIIDRTLKFRSRIACRPGYVTRRVVSPLCCLLDNQARVFGELLRGGTQRFQSRPILVKQRFCAKPGGCEYHEPKESPDRSHDDSFDPARGP